MKIGFTGTRHGMTQSQSELVLDFLSAFKDHGEREFHHGCCIGADEQAAKIAKSLGFIIHGHPPLNNKFLSTFQNDYTFWPEEYIVRNHAIVDSTECLIACPFDSEEHLRSGTWATWRYANSVPNKSVVLYPGDR